MLYWAFVFLAVGILASLFGFGGLSAAAFSAVKVLLLLKVIGIILFLAGVGFLFGHMRRGSGTPLLR